MNMGRMQRQKHGWWSWLLWLVLLVGLPSQSLVAFSNAIGDNLRAGVPNAERARLDSQYDDAGRRFFAVVRSCDMNMVLLTQPRVLILGSTTRGQTAVDLGTTVG